MFDFEFLVWLRFRTVVVLELSVIFKLLSVKLQIGGQMVGKYVRFGIFGLAAFSYGGRFGIICYFKVIVR